MTKTYSEKIAVYLLLIEMPLYFMYFFFYDPMIGALPILLCSFISIFGLIFSFKTKKIKYKTILILSHLASLIAFPVLFFIAAYFGF